MKFLKPKIFLILVPLLFFLVSLSVISDYGISWDEPNHFIRGQAFIDYFLTGDPNYPNLKTAIRPSYYQDPSQPAKYFFENDSGHPPLNGTLAALFNVIFYQKVGLLGDIQAHHLFNIFSATFLILVVMIFAYQAYGPFVALIAGLSLAMYPLLFGEAQFNVKDPTETAFFGLTIWTFWQAIERKDWRWLLGAIVSFGLALAVKFNILFLPFTLIPWLIIRYWKELVKPVQFLKSWPKIFLLLLFLSPLIVFAIFFFTWPYLWQDPLINTGKIVEYYLEIGTAGRGQPDFILPGGFNSFPLVWIIITTPPLVLILSLLGGISLFSRRKEKGKVALLWLFWLVVPIARVSWPNSSIYGGIRQIMEFLPALALMAGFGAEFLIKIFKQIFSFLSFKKQFWQFLILFLFIPNLLVLIKLHPNENVYFNFLIGGLKGADQAKIPYAGNSFGNAYYQAIQWLNENAEPGSKLALIQGTGMNIPKITLNQNLQYSNGYWSGVDRKGEYLLELTHRDYAMAYTFVWDYVNTVLIPVYEVEVDGVAIAKIWKNDLEHSKPEYQEEETLPIKKTTMANDILLIELDNIHSLARITIKYSYLLQSCTPFTSGVIEISQDGQHWFTQEEKISDQQTVYYPSLEDGLVRYLFAVRQAKYIRIKTGDPNSCLLRNLQIKVQGF